MKLEDEDIDYLRELAERDYVARIAQEHSGAKYARLRLLEISVRKWTYEKIGPAVAQDPARMRLIQHRRDCTDEL
ncbi:MAG: hypothetical protein ACLR8P_01485 [Clostridium fessum]